MQNALDNYLSALRVDGEFQSKGSFGLSREKALQKITELGLPFEGAWALKFVQAAVEAGGRSVDVKLSKKQIVLSCPCRKEWDLDHVDRVFHLQETPRDLAHDHLSRALWALQKDFLFELVWDRRLCWNGKSFEWGESTRQSGKRRLSITIETAGKGWSFTRYFRVARTNATVSKVLQEGAFAAPIPVRVDGRRVNTLHACPTHREVSKKYKLAAIFLQGCPPPGLSLPWQSEEYSSVSRQIEVASLHKIKCAVLMTISSIYSFSEGTNYHSSDPGFQGTIRWVSSPPGSLFYWIQSGVAIQTESLPSEGQALSWAVLLSADGLETDLTSLSLMDCEEISQRKRAVMKSFLKNLKSYRLRSKEVFGQKGPAGKALARTVGELVWVQRESWKSRFGSKDYKTQMEQ